MKPATYQPRQKVWIYHPETDTWGAGRVVRTETDGIRVAVYQPMPYLGSLVNLYPPEQVAPRYDGQHPPERS